MVSPKKNENKGFFASFFGSSTSRSANGVSEEVEVINPEGGKEDAEEEAHRGRWKDEERDSYWKMMQKYIGSDITSMVTLPVVIFEPMTMLQKMAEIMEYSYLLDQADECEDPYLRLVYASSWAVSVYYAFQRTWKPFNPILGETYEMINHGGISFVSEQVSHHPPMSAGHAENEHFTYDITSKLKTKLLGNSVDVYPVGRTRVTLKRDGVVLDLVPPLTKIHNLIFGRTWVDSPGEMVMTNLTTGDKVVLYFQPCGWFGSGRYEVDGYVYSAAEEPKIMMTGKWNEKLSYQPCDLEGEPLPGTELKEVWHLADVPKNDKFDYTHFAHKINSFNTAPGKLLASDSRLRPDRYALEQGDLSKAGAEKHSLEERQRAEKRTRETKGHKFTPRWFDLTEEITSTPWGDIEVYQYNGKYTEHRGTTESSSSASNEEDLKSIEFNPWQYDTRKDFLKKKRAPSKHTAGLSLEDLSKYFGLTIVEASQKLNVGLTVLKKKCRELGIPRWPHRKIKSLDSLIQDLQGEVEGQPEKNEEAAIAAAKRRKQSEKRNIVEKPFMEIQKETKRFRQSNFNKRHKASRAKKNQASS